MPEKFSDIFFSPSGARNRSGSPSNRNSRVPSNFESFIGLGTKFAAQFLPPVISGSIIRGIGFFNSLLLGDPIPDKRRKEDTISGGTDYPSFPIDDTILQVTTDNLGIRQGTVVYNLSKFGKSGSVRTQTIPIPDIDGIITELRDDGSLLLGKNKKEPTTRISSIPENESKNDNDVFGANASDTGETTSRFKLSEMSRYAANKYFSPSRFYIDSMSPPNANYNIFSGQNIKEILSILNLSIENISFPGKSVDTFDREITSDIPTKMPGKMSYQNTLVLTVRCSNTMSEYQFFQSWLSAIFYNPNIADVNRTEKRDVQFNYGCMNYFKDYATTITFSLLNWSNIPIYKLSLIDCYPTEISPIDVSQESTDIAKFTVTLTYKRWIEQDFTEVERKMYQLQSITGFQNLKPASLNDYTSLRTATSAVNSNKQNPVKNKLVPDSVPYISLPDTGNVSNSFTSSNFRIGGLNSTNFTNGFGL